MGGRANLLVWGGGGGGGNPVAGTFRPKAFFSQFENSSFFFLFSRFCFFLDCFFSRFSMFLCCFIRFFVFVFSFIFSFFPHFFCIF